jgi:hypothetical protein
MTRSEAQKLIADIVKLRESATDAQASSAVSVYPTLKQDGSLIKSGTRINYNGTIIRAAVDLYDTETNSPENAPILWETLNYKDGYRIIPEVITVGTAFSKGELGWWNDELYESLVDSNVYTPAQYAPNWSKQ